MGCKGSKHALHGGGGGGGARAPEPRRCSGLVGRHSVALRSSTLGTLSLDRAAAAAATVSLAGEEEEEVMMMMVKSGDEGGGTGRYRATPRSVVASGGWCPGKRQRKAPSRTPTKTPMRDPEEINVWELMEGLEDDEGGCDGVERQVLSAPGSPVFDPNVLAAFREALDELSPPPAPDAIKKDDIQMFAGGVRSPVDVFQQKIDAKSVKEAPGPPPLPESTRRVVVYLTSLRGIRQTHEDCWAVSAILRSYGVRVDERDLSMHAGYKDELHAALPVPPSARHGIRLPHVFVDGWYLGGAEEVRSMHESGELAEALEACCDAVAAPGAGGGKGGSLALEPCDGCGGARFMPCDECFGSCKVFVEEEDGGGGAFKRCPECNENGLVRCPIC